MKQPAAPSLYLYDDPADVGRFQPFSQSRPIGELRYGAYLLRERVELALGDVTAYLDAGHLSPFVEHGAPPVVAEAGPQRPRLYLRSTFAIEKQNLNMSAAKGVPGVRLLDAAGATVGMMLASGTTWRGPGIPASWPSMTLKGKRLDGVWQIIADLVPALQADLAAERKRRKTRRRVPAGCHVIGKAADVFLDAGTMIEPEVVFDTRHGPIWIQRDVEIRAFTRLEGPLVAGAGSKIVRGSVRESSIGPRCVVHGEVSNAVFLGYANKAHEGFLGHAMVGRWANLGANTNNSNLKNTYGTVRLNLGTERVETGMMLMGSLIGDHVKTAIGTMLPTGCVIGTGANLFGTRRPESFVPAFAWGTDEPGRRLNCRMFLQTAARVFPRRGVACDAPMRAYLESVWRHCTGQPCD